MVVAAPKFVVAAVYDVYDRRYNGRPLRFLMVTSQPHRHNLPMAYSVQIATVTEQLLAASRQETTLTRVSQDIQRLLQAPWALIRQNPDLRRDGHNVAVYRNEPNGVSVEVGVQVVRAFDPTSLVVCSSTPGGTVATTAHFGPYSALGGAHRAVCAWCDQNGRALAGVSWEIYGDWNDDPAKLRTDVLYLLA